jgi:hypothetical protein
MEYKVGMRVFVVFSYGNKTHPLWCEVAKVGRKYATLDNGWKAPINGDTAGPIPDYPSMGKVYESEAAYLEYQAFNQLWRRLYEVACSPPRVGISSDDIRRALDILTGVKA